LKLLGQESWPPDAHKVPIFAKIKADLQKYLSFVWLGTNGKCLFRLFRLENQCFRPLTVGSDHSIEFFEFLKKVFQQILVEQRKLEVLLINLAILWNRIPKNQEKILRFQTQRICYLEWFLSKRSYSKFDFGTSKIRAF
jgi:hypothetical protein